MGQYFLLEDFRRGLDVRKLRNTSPSGALIELNNGFVNAGGEVEKRRAFQQNATLTAELNAIVTAGGKWVGPQSAGDGRFVFFYTGTYTPTNGTAFGVSYVFSKLDTALDVLEVRYSAPYGDNIYVVVLTNDASRHFYGALGGLLVPVVDGAGNQIRHGYAVLHQDKVYRALGATSVGGPGVFEFSAVGNPADLTGVGSGSVDASKRGGAVGPISGLGVYYDQLVVFGSAAAQLWAVDPDPAKYQFTQSVPGISIAGGFSITPYADGDVLMLTKSGVRSLQARDSSNYAAAGDIGSPVDDLVVTAIREALDLEGIRNSLNGSRGMVEQQLGQFWLFLDLKAYVLSRFPAGDVRAWSTYSLPTTTRVAHVATVDGITALGTEDNEVWFYGDVTYDTTEVEVVTPHLDFGKPATEKVFRGIDIAATGTWTLQVSYDPDNIVWETVATITGSSFRQNRIAVAGASTHIACRLTTAGADAARLAQVAFHYDEAEAG